MKIESFNVMNIPKVYFVYFFINFILYPIRNATLKEERKNGSDAFKKAWKIRQ